MINLSVIASNEWTKFAIYIPERDIKCIKKNTHRMFYSPYLANTQVRDYLLQLRFLMHILHNNLCFLCVSAVYVLYIHLTIQFDSDYE